MTGTKVSLAVEAGIAWIRLDGPERRNALDAQAARDLAAICDIIDADPAAGVAVITGTGRAFCSGADTAILNRIRAASPDQAYDGLDELYAGFRRFAGLKVPTVAAVNGAAAGLGCDMALACDFIVASEQAMFTMSFVKRGLVSDGGGMYFLPRRVGLPKAKELIFTGRSVDANEALAIGLADRVTSADTLVADAAAWARELGQGSSASIAFSKAILDRTFETTEEQVFALGREAQAVCYTTQEHRDSVEAFLNKSGR